MRTKLLTSIAAGAVICGAGFIADTVSAQTTAGTTASTTDGTGITEVVVTAEKRSTNAQKTSIALSVITSDTLKKNGVGDIGDLATIAPSINFAQNAGAATVTVRGVSSRDITEVGDPAVAINLDGVFLQRPTGMDASFYDLERIEVLRGPQGTLYGRNATGGVINIITQKPTQTYGGYAALSYGDYSTINIEGAVNLPLTDTLAMRVSYVSRQHDGYVNNGVAGRGDDEDEKGGRIQLLYKPTSKLKILAGVNYLDQGGIGPVYEGFPLTTVSPPTKESQIKDFALNDRGDLNVRRTNANLQVDYDFDFATLTYLGGFVGLNYKQLWDVDGRADENFLYNRNEVSGDTSHELRLASNNKTGFTWQTGVYFYNQDLDLNNNFDLTPNKVPVSVREYHYDVKAGSFAAFAQGAYDFTDKLRLSAGIRYSEDDKSRTGYSYVGSLTQNVSSGTAVRTYALENSHASSDKVTWHLGLDYQATPRNLLYAKIDTGYKAGGFTSIAAYNPETLTSYEVGSKNRFLSNTLQLNGSVFYYDYKDQQVTQFISSGVNAGQSTVINAGASEIYGAELEGTWLATPADKIDGSVAYLHAVFTDFQVANGASNLDLDGNKVIQSPEWSLNGGYEHVFKSQAGTWTPRLQAIYRSSSYLTFYNRANDRQAPYTLVDAMLTYAPSNANWSIQGYVHNIGDTVVLTNADQGGPYNAIRYQFGSPRTYGVRLQTSW